MNVNDYRRDYAKFCAARERERFLRHLGLAPDPQIESPLAAFAHLFSLQAINNLNDALNDVAEHFETERAGVHALLAAARLVYVETQNADAREEIASCEEATNFIWNGASVPASENGAKSIAAEPAPARRREIAARWFDAIRSCDDLRAAHTKSLHIAARSLGFDNYRALRLDACRANLDGMHIVADEFLERTASIYELKLAQWAAQNVALSTPSDLSYADSLFFKRAAKLDDRFRGKRLRDVYHSAMRGLGIRVEQQPNIIIDDSALPSNEAHTACFGIKPPEEVRLVIGTARARVGANEYQSFLGEAGRAQHHAWTSHEMRARYPEFVYAPDRATGGAYAFLFRALLQDAQWLSEHFAFAAKTANDTARAFALLELHDARLAGARVQAETALPNDSNSVSQKDAEDYARLMTEATGFRHNAATYLIDWDARLQSFDELRARLFAAHLCEHLRTQHGRRWWTTRAARDELIDLWNTGSRYSVEELVGHLTGTREFEVELLTRASIEALSEA